MKTLLALLLFCFGLPSANAQFIINPFSVQSSAYIPPEDDFNRADFTSLGSKWTDIEGGHSIVGNAARSELGSFAKNLTVWNTPTQTLNQWIKHKYIQNGSTGGFIGPVFRFQNAASPVYINDFNATQLFWGYYPDAATVSGGGQRNIINGTAHGILDTEFAAWALSGTGAATRLRIWRNPTGNIDPGGATWGGGINPIINQLIDAGGSADVGKQVGICGFQTTSVVTLDDFSAGDVPEGSSLLVDLIGGWNLTEASGPRLNPFTFTNNLSDGNTVTSAVDGTHGTVADFELSNQESLSANSNATLQAGDVDFSASVWVKLESKGASMSIIGKPSSSSAELSEWFLQFDHTADRFKFHVFLGGAVTTVTADNLGAPALDTWYHLAVIHDAANNQISIQVNNGTANTAAHSGGTNVTNSPFTLGSIESALQWFDGQMSKAFFWKRTLTTLERAALAFGAAYPFLP